MAVASTPARPRRSPRWSSPQSPWRDLALLCGVAFVLRLVWVLVYGRVDPPEGLLNDPTFYQYAAVNLATEGEYDTLTGEPTAGWPPGFPFVISLLFRGFGIHLKLALALNIVLSVATVALLYVVARRMFGRPAAVIAGGTWAILPGPLYFNGLFMSESLFIFMLVGVLALAVFLPDRRWTAVVLGIALGAAALTRGEGLLMPVIVLAMWWGHVPRREWVLRTAVLLAAMVLTVAPWTIRNATVLDAFVPVSNNASWTLYTAHNPKANGGALGVAELKVDETGLSETERAAVRRRAALEWARDNPLKELGLIPRRLLALNGPSSGLITWINQGRPDQRQLKSSSVLVFSILGDAFGYILLGVTLGSLAIVGVRRLWRAHPAMQGVFAYLALCLFNYGVLYFGQYRYRIPMEPFMVLVAAPFLAAIWSQRGALKGRAVPPSAAPLDSH